jgi:hypothetical protein
LPAEHLSGLAGDVAQPSKHWSRRGKQPVLTSCRGKLSEPRTEHEAALQIATYQPMMLKGDGKAMGRRSGQSGGCHQTCQGGRSGLQGAEHQGGFVEDADAARVVHALILPSRMLDGKWDD